MAHAFGGPYAAVDTADPCSRSFYQICTKMAGIDSVDRILVLDLLSSIDFDCEFGSIAFVFANEFSIAVSIGNQDFAIFR